MNKFLDIALAHAAAGLRVFPVRKDKGTLTAHGFKDATQDTEQIRKWWAQWPEANPAVHGGSSGKAILDIDHGLTDVAAFQAWRERNGIPRTYVVRTGSRPEFKVHMYFEGAMPDVGSWELDGCSGQVKSMGGYVLAAGSEALHGTNHDLPGAPYEVIDGTLGEFAPLPEVVRTLRKPKAEVTTNSSVVRTRWDLPVHESEDRTGFLMEQCGALRNLGCGFDSIFSRMAELNDDADIIADPIDAERLRQTAENCVKYPVPAPEPEIVIGKPTEPIQVTDWRELFHTQDETTHAPKIKFSIEGFLQDEGITAISAPPGHRKTLAMLNMVLSLMTGKDLFKKFKVNAKAERVVYLVPEIALAPFAHRIKQFGLVEYVGTKFFYRTLSAQGKLLLGDDALMEAVKGAHVFLDTVPRFVEGNENDAQDVRRLGEQLFRLLQAGARSVVGAFHMPKGAKRNDFFDLETCVRGSSDLGALLSACWGTRLQDEKEPYQSPSYMECVKGRDFEACAPFELLSSETGIMSVRVGVTAVSLKPGLGNYHASNKDGLEQMALDYIRQHPYQSLRQMEEGLKALGITRRKDWVSKKRKLLLSSNTGVVCLPADNQIEKNP